MYRTIVRLILLVAVVLSAPAALAQIGFDRRGGDYLNFPVRSGDPAQCAARCDRDSHCRAWSFAYPAGDRAAVCWLKSQVPPRIEDSGAASGVRGAGVIEPRHGAREFSMDRVGGDYRNVEVPSDHSGESCRSLCEAESKCRAWTYARSGYLGPQARCFLKDHVMPPQHKPCCISGVVR
jgi:hypothetical protein